MIRPRVPSACALVLLGACSRETPPTPVVPGVSDTIAADPLDHLDKRAPVPLLATMANHQKQNMRDHLMAVQEIVVRLSTADFAGVERAAARVGFSEQMGQMCTHMGAGAPGFSEQALEFHHTADRIASAARDRDARGVLTELAATLQTCTSCHAVWKQHVVDEPTWARLTSLAAPLHGAR
jgi:hypothetical protein